MDTDTTHSVPENFYSSVRKALHSYSQKVTASLETGKSKSHVFVLDGVRAIACLAVISYHANFLSRNYGIWKPGNPVINIAGALACFGESGVILFFLLSGFLLFLPFARTLLFGGQWPSVLRFYLRRIFRIIPGYFVALFLIVLFFHPEFFHANDRGQLLEFLTFRMNYALSQQLNGPFWTLAVEFQFYMLLPIIAWVFSLLVNRGTLAWRMIKLTCCLLAMLTWGLLSRYWGLTIAPASGQNIWQTVFLTIKPYVYSDTGKYFESFAMGMLIAMVYVYTQNAPAKEAWFQRFRGWSLWMFPTGLLILIFLTLLHFYVININPSNYHMYYEIFPPLDPYNQLINQLWQQWESIGYSICYGLCIFALLYGSLRLRRPFEWPLLRWIGIISFSLYMWHLPLIFLYMNVILHQFVGWGSVIKYIGLTAWIVFLVFPVSLTLYRWIEMPGIRLGEAIIQRIEQKRKKRSFPGIEDIPTQKMPSLPARIEAL